MLGTAYTPTKKTITSLLKLIKEISDKEYSYGCAMLYYNFPEITKIQDRIDKSDLYTEDGFGLEDEPHVTLLYGFHEEVEPIQIQDIVQKFTFAPTRINNVSLFKNENYEVLKFEAKSPNLYKCNKTLRKLPHTSSYPTYNPHMTIAYLQPGTGEKYVKKFKGFDHILSPDHGMYSDGMGTKSKFKIKCME